MTLSDFLSEHGFATAKIDGTFQQTEYRWLIGWESPSGAARVRIGDWRTGDKFLYEGATSGEITDADKAAWKDAEEKANLQKEEDNRRAAEEAAKVLADCATTGALHPYLLNKKIDKFYGSGVIFKDGDRILCIPIYYEESLAGIQFIGEKGYKRFLPGTRMKKSYAKIGDVKDRIFITEGFATGCTVHMSTGDAVYCAMNAGNLREIAIWLRGKYPDKELIIAADDDFKTDGNPGLSKARAAASSSNAKVILPVWTNSDRGNGTDWNDLHCSKSLDAVRDGITYQLDQGVPATLDGVRFLTRISDNGKLTLPKDSEIASEILRASNGKWVKAFGELYVWKGTHWRCYDEEQMPEEVRPIMERIIGPQYDYAKVRAIHGILLKNHLPEKSKYMHQGTTVATSFANGTLRLAQEGLENALYFDPTHRMDDYLSSVLPFDLDTTAGDPVRFITWLREHLFAETDQIEEQISLIQEIVGACLLPNFPLLVFFVGRPCTGKSTFIKIMRSLMDRDYISTLDPVNMGGFGAEGMIGKKVNIVTDLDTSHPIAISVLKQVEDRTPVSIQRKFKLAAISHLPAVHLYASNDMPNIQEDSSGAIERRCRVFKCNNVIEKTITNFSDIILHGERREIVSWGFRGLQRVVERGGYSYPDILKRHAREWTGRYDAVTTFITDIQEGGIHGVSYGPDCAITRKRLRELFIEWSQKSYPKRITEIDCRKLLNTFDTKKRDGIRYCLGIGERTDF